MRDAWISDVRGTSAAGYIVKVRLGTSDVCLLVDTGATASLIKENGMIFKRPLSPSTVRLRGVMGHLLPLLGAITLSVETLYGEFPQQFHVVGKDFKLPCDGILGLDFLRKHDASLDFAKERIRLRDTTLPLHPLQREDRTNLGNVAEPIGGKQSIADGNELMGEEGKREEKTETRNSAKAKPKKYGRTEIKRKTGQKEKKEQEENKLTDAEEAKSFQVRVGKVVKLPPRSEAIT